MDSNLNGSRGTAVSNWILIGIFMLIIQVILGGITRLTGSGLSITEWNVVTGAIPPLSEQGWLVEFEKYQATPQYRILNADFTLGDFKFIFFWEWFHRFWARLIGVVFVIGFIYLVAKKKLKPEMQRPLLILFLLGALQGAVGWIMVASGLTGDAVYVKPTRLALHFIFALGLIAYAYWFYLQLTVKPGEKTAQPALKKRIIWLVIILVPQLMYGALMAGHKPATSAATWPTINGEWIPEALFRETPWLLNFIENKLTVHFVHRGLAYLLLVMVVLFTVKAFKTKSVTDTFKRWAKWPLLLTFLQALLGIFAVLTSTKIIPNQWGVFEWMAQLHQVVGMLLLGSLLRLLFLLQTASRNL
ncbi:MAG: COX15/CtaA family protein [Chitinophagaceae bacterium]